MDVLFLMNFFRMHPGLKISSENKSVCKIFFQSASFCWDSTLPLFEMEQEFFFGGTIGYGDSSFEFLSRHLKIFALHAKLHDATGAVKAHSGKRSG